MASTWLQWELISPGVDHSSWLSVVSSWVTCRCLISMELELWSALFPPVPMPSERAAWEPTSSVLLTLLIHTWLSSGENPGGDQMTVSRPMTDFILSLLFMSVFLDSHLTSSDTESVRKVGDVAGLAQSLSRSPGQRAKRDQRKHWLKAEQPRLDSKEVLSQGPVGQTLGQTRSSVTAVIHGHSSSSLALPCFLGPVPFKNSQPSLS